MGCGAFWNYEDLKKAAATGSELDRSEPWVSPTGVNYLQKNHRRLSVGGAETVTVQCCHVTSQVRHTNSWSHAKNGNSWWTVLYKIPSSCRSLCEQKKHIFLLPVCNCMQPCLHDAQDKTWTWAYLPYRLVWQVNPFAGMQIKFKVSS